MNNGWSEKQTHIIWIPDRFAIQIPSVLSFLDWLLYWSILQVYSKLFYSKNTKLQNGKGGRFFQTDTQGGGGQVQIQMSNRYEWIAVKVVLQFYRCVYICAEMKTVNFISTYIKSKIQANKLLIQFSLHNLTTVGIWIANI